MSPSELAIMNFFRRYEMGPAKMLFFNPADCKLGPGPFLSAMESLMRRGLVTKERPKLAYALTSEGYDLSLSLPAESKNRNCRAGSAAAFAPPVFVPVSRNRSRKQLNRSILP